MQKHKFEAIGTSWSIETPRQLSESAADEINARIETFDKTYSRFRKDALVARLRGPGEYIFPPDAVRLMKFYRDLYEATNGAVTPLVGGALEHAGYDAKYSLQAQPGKPTTQRWDDVMKWHRTKVTVYEPIVLDVGAAGKGYLIDLVARLLTSHNIKEFIIDASGDIRHAGTVAERIGLENPYDPSSVVGVAELSSSSLCGSASNRRAWGNWHHIIDPRSGEPVREVVATWAVAKEAMIADGLATALFFVPPSSLKKWDFQAVRLFADGRIEKTPGFVGELYI